jgi:hypothetical protein
VLSISGKRFRGQVCELEENGNTIRMVEEKSRDIFKIGQKADAG